MLMNHVKNGFSFFDFDFLPDSALVLSASTRFSNNDFLPIVKRMLVWNM